MFRRTPAPCTKSNTARFGRASPGKREDAQPRLRMVDAIKSNVNLEQIEDNLFLITRKEKQS